MLILALSSSFFPVLKVLFLLSLKRGSFTEEKLKKRSVALVPFRRLIARGWAPSGVASSLDGRPAFGSGVRAFFSGVGLPVQVFPVTVSSGRISVFGVASISVNVRLLLLAPLPSSPVLDSRLLSPCHAPPWCVDPLSALNFSEDRSGWTVFSPLRLCFVGVPSSRFSFAGG
ncbi:hypothetical protein HID58_075854 [Brassica napus]|uniref:Secreted protein n=1 Tax=Brassica napus TaxID=3708 RepID=A0ABQ7YKW0_BRANA|nr:hypothetical protein HID58_075854 [Brassica napus]